MGPPCRCPPASPRPQTVLKDHSDEFLFFTQALTPWGERPAPQPAAHCCQAARPLRAAGPRAIGRRRPPAERLLPPTACPPPAPPAVHYVPIRWNRPDELFAAVRWLRANDAVARSVAAAGRAFAAAHLVEEGRLCYLKVLLEELAMLAAAARRRRRARADFPRLVPVEAELARLPKPARGVGMREQR